ncbi:dCMP deaminase [Streptomyces sp. NBC_01335]|nr:dCMP deaminase [Streptomyces sp. NBC_01335]
MNPSSHGPRRLTAADTALLSSAVALAHRCPPSPTAYSVGAVVADSRGTVLATGYSREDGTRVHAEEAALRRLPPGTDLTGATLYCSLEPCSQRANSPVSCADLLIAAGIGRVVVAWREPPLFVASCSGLDRLRAAGVRVEYHASLAEAARAANRHLPLPSISDHPCDGLT